MTLLAVFVVLLFLHALASARLERMPLTAPIVFTTAGMIAAGFVPPQGGRPEHLYEDLAVFRKAAEIALVLLLFTDANRARWKGSRTISTRLLAIGKPLTILLGAVVAKGIFPALTIWEALVLGAILAPTDARLAPPIVEDPRVPNKIRQSLVVETGLNGFTVPFLILFRSMAEPDDGSPAASFTTYVREQLELGAFVGLAIGGLGGWLLGLATRRKWIAPEWSTLGVIVLPLLAFVTSEAVGASTYIAAFVAGMFVRLGFKQAEEHCVEFNVRFGHLLNLSVFFLFGMVFVRRWSSYVATDLLYAALSLTVVRMAPVAIALLGSRMSGATTLFLGWFGPRGIASIVLGVVFLDHTKAPGAEAIRGAVMVTVLLSVFAHGLTARPWTRLYARKAAALPPSAPDAGP